MFIFLYIIQPADVWLIIMGLISYSPWEKLTLGLRVSPRRVLHYHPPSCDFVVLPLRLQVVAPAPLGCIAAPRLLGLLFALSYPTQEGVILPLLLGLIWPVLRKMKGKCVKSQVLTNKAVSSAAKRFLPSMASARAPQEGHSLPLATRLPRCLYTCRLWWFWFYTPANPFIEWRSTQEPEALTTNQGTCFLSAHRYILRSTAMVIRPWKDHLHPLPPSSQWPVWQQH